MALSDRVDRVLMSPGCEVVMAGLRGDTRHMQAQGWEFAMEYRPWDCHYYVAMRHPDSGLAAYGKMHDLSPRNLALRVSNMAMFSGSFPKEPERAVIYVDRIGHEAQMRTYYAVDALPKYQRVDMNTSVATMDSQMVAKTLFELGVFKPWQPEAPELIVDPNSVADLMDRIRKLQDPELAAIRKRNRAREQANPPQERIVAQVIALAA